MFPNLQERGLAPYFAAIGEQTRKIQSIVVSRDAYGDIGEYDIELLSQLPHLNRLRISI